jgi:DNA-binding MarR family transcriptional regulator
MDVLDFRQRVRALVRELGVLDEARTPCGADLSVREAYALDAIATAEAAGNPLSQSDLQATLGVDKSNVTRLVQQLVAAGRIEQRAGEADARIRHLHLTSKGRRTARTVDALSMQRFARVVARIPVSQQAEVLRALDLFRAALEADAQATDG